MHPINRILTRWGLQLHRAPRPPRDFLKQYARDLETIRRNRRGFVVFRDMFYEVGAHPEDSGDFECRFAAKHVARARPASILDVGSYRFFVLGLLTGYRVTTVDVRSRLPSVENERVIVGDAKRLALPNDSFDMITSLCAIEHFGLGRYGDEFDENGDLEAMKEWVRVLKPGGRLVFSTTITRGRPAIAFNSHRIYSLDQIDQLGGALTCEDREFFSISRNRSCTFDEITADPAALDIYAGCWRKPSPTP